MRWYHFFRQQSPFQLPNRRRVATHFIYLLFPFPMQWDVPFSVARDRRMAHTGAPHGTHERMPLVRTCWRVSNCNNFFVFPPRLRSSILSNIKLIRPFFDASLSLPSCLCWPSSAPQAFLLDHESAVRVACPRCTRDRSESMWDLQS